MVDWKKIGPLPHTFKQLNSYHDGNTSIEGGQIMEKNRFDVNVPPVTRLLWLSEQFKGFQDENTRSNSHLLRKWQKAFPCSSPSRLDNEKFILLLLIVQPEKYFCGEFNQIVYWKVTLSQSNWFSLIFPFKPNNEEHFQKFTVWRQSDWEKSEML